MQSMREVENFSINLINARPSQSTIMKRLSSSLIKLSKEVVEEIEKDPTNPRTKIAEHY